MPARPTTPTVGKVADPQRQECDADQLSEPFGTDAYDDLIREMLERRVARTASSKSRIWTSRQSFPTQSVQDWCDGRPDGGNAGETASSRPSRPGPLRQHRQDADVR